MQPKYLAEDFYAGVEDGPIRLSQNPEIKDGKHYQITHTEKSDENNKIFFSSSIGAKIK